MIYKKKYRLMVQFQLFVILHKRIGNFLQKWSPLAEEIFTILKRNVLDKWINHLTYDMTTWNDRLDKTITLQIHDGECMLLIKLVTLHALGNHPFSHIKRFMGRRGIQCMIDIKGRQNFKSADSIIKGYIPPRTISGWKRYKFSTLW